MAETLHFGSTWMRVRGNGNPRHGNGLLESTIMQQ
eukprot:CAMPEP_0180802566 /NCGR_PEP_ID=MMETSP1038_2-20121128/60370_1 /TAXON_ID=632150 /ORGANISM="Azadinium spinosum, Strain 3D9" /LENGTH=34 /DNA_ID= /DNA_START= /DNA_END= /DNA_ORIENTATION=